MNKASSGDNEYYTPIEVWKSIIKYLPKNKIGCEPFTLGDSRIGSLSFFKHLGLDIKGGTGDFFKQTNFYDYVISNPPYTTYPPFNGNKPLENIKYRIMQRLKNFNVPFMLLLPLNTISSSYFKILFNEDDKQSPHLQLINYCGAIKYYKIDKEGRMNFKKQPAMNSCFICWKMNLPKDLILRNPPPFDMSHVFTDYHLNRKNIRGTEKRRDYKSDFSIPTITVEDYDEPEKGKKTIYKPVSKKKKKIVRKK